jgi:predicted nucleic acid-binding Zn ribbon protein
VSARRRDRRAPEPAGALVAGVLARTGVASAVREHRLVTEWATMVGERVAARAWPDSLERGVLYVRVVSSAWMHELGFLRAPLLEAARRVTGDPPLVKEIRFHLGARRQTSDDDAVAALARKRRAPRPAARPAPPLSPEAAARIDRETERVGDEELREIIREAWRRLPTPDR